MLIALFALALHLQAPLAPTATDDFDIIVQHFQSEAADEASVQAAIARILDRARKGDAESMGQVGSLVDLGLLADDPPAEVWFRSAMEHSTGLVHDSARLNLAYRLYGQRSSSPEARSLLQSHEFTLPEHRAEARGLLGYDYLVGLGGAEDRVQGERLLDQAIEEGFSNPNLLEAYAMHWRDQYGDDQAHHDRIAELLFIAADAGSDGAAWQLGMFILNTGGDEADAYLFVSVAAENGYVQGMISRAVMLATGQGVERDQAEARNWYLRAVRQSSAHALRGYGAMLVVGEGGAPDPVLGYGMLALAAEAGDALAANTMQWLIDHGHPRPETAESVAALDAFLHAEGLDPGQFR